jgi:hypothetical protein
MVSQCANPQCAARFRYLHQGKVFLVERKNGNGNSRNAASRLEYFWLCSDCAPRMTLETEQGSGVVRVAENASCASRLAR